jgi:glycosyltransferase involved in cell wall biosynthesis
MITTENQKVLIITYYWPPAGGPGVQRWLKFAKYLTEFDFTPVILTVDPERASYQIIDESLVAETRGMLTFYTSTFEPFGFYRKITGTEKLPVGGTDFSEKGKILGKLLLFIRGNCFIPDPRRGWNIFAYHKAKKLIREYGINTIITTSPPHSTQLLGLKLKRKFSLRLIADFRDPWTDIYYYNEFLHSRLARILDSHYERKVLRSADQIIVVSNSIRHVFTQKLPPERFDKVTTIPNGFDEADFKIPPQKNKTDSFTIVYTGTIGSLYGVKGFLDALKIFASKGKQFNLKFIGKTDNYIYNLVSKKELNDYTEFIPYADHQKSVEYIVNIASVLLLCIPDIENNKGILTGKLFEYLASRKPIVCIGPVDGDAAAIINECEAGKVFDYQDVQHIADFIDDVKENRFRINLNNMNYLGYSRKGWTEKLVELIMKSQAD